MRKLLQILIPFLVGGFAFACTPGQLEQEEETSSYLEGKGGRYYGGILRINESEYIKNLFPHNITDVYSYRVASQVYEGLFKFDQRDLSINPSLAKTYEIDSTGTIFTFYLKEGVLFHDDPVFPDQRGRELTSADVAYCFTRLCTPHPNNKSFTLFKDVVRGANAYYNSKAVRTNNEYIEGIRILDKYTIQLTLTRPNSMFLTILARPACFIYPKEAEEAYGLDMRIKAIGTGPFFLSEVEEDIKLILKRNEIYHGTDTFGNRLPFLEAISIQFIKDKKLEFLQFKKGDLDMVYRLPAAYINEILEDTDPNERGEYEQYQLQRSPEMVTQFLAFNNAHPVFKDKNVRKAFSYAIDREKILEFVLKGEGYSAGIHGITPPVFAHYDIRKIAGYYLHVDSAKYYLAKAGFPNGLNFPDVTLYFNAEGERNTMVAVEVQKQLADHLNVKVILNTLPFAQLLEKAYKGEYGLLRTAWYADFPSVGNFLWLFNEHYENNTTVAHPNIMRFEHKGFQRKYEQALQAKTVREANSLFMEAEQLLMEEAPVLILWYDEGYRLLHYYVKNFPMNPMQYRDFSEVFFQRSKKLEG